MKKSSNILSLIIVSVIIKSCGVGTAVTGADYNYLQKESKKNSVLYKKDFITIFGNIKDTIEGGSIKKQISFKEHKLKINGKSFPITTVNSYQKNGVFKVRVFEYPRDFIANNRAYFFDRVIDGPVIDLFFGELTRMEPSMKNGMQERQTSAFVIVHKKDYSTRIVIGTEELKSIMKDDQISIDYIEKNIKNQKAGYFTDYRKLMEVVNMYNKNMKK